MLTRIATALAVSVVCTGTMFAQTSIINQTATVTRNVILRPDPSSTGTEIETLSPGDEVTVFDGPQTGYYHVQAKDTKIGWVWMKNIRLAPSAVPMNALAKHGSTTKTAAHVDPSNCSASLWAHTYNPDRLQLHDECVTVTGTIQDATAPQTKHYPDGMRHEDDGDTHGWLKLDPQFAWMLDPGNKSDEDSNLVFELVCHYTIRKNSKAALDACSTFKDTQALPPIGTHVEITGRFVLDSHHAHWNEIHPVSTIKAK